MQLIPLPDPAQARRVSPAAGAPEAAPQTGAAAGAGSRAAQVIPFPQARRIPCAEGTEPPLRDVDGVPLRPRLLWRAAQVGAKLYKRETHLRMAAPGIETSGGAKAILARLAELEEVLEHRRRAHAPEYASRRHVLVLAAFLAERAAAREAAKG